LVKCAAAVRAIRLLTAEAKRRAVLLKACCSEYELALDRLSEARLHVLQEDLQHRGDATEADVRRPGSSGKPARQREAGSGRFEALHQAKPGVSGAASSNAEKNTNLRESLAETTAAIGTATAGDSISETLTPSSPRDGRLVVSDFDFFGTSEDSSRITKSLEEILEQARSIRISNSHNETAGAERKTGGSGSGSGSGSIIISSDPSKAVGSRRGKGQSRASSRSGVRGAPTGATDAIPRPAGSSILRGGARAQPAGSASNALLSHAKRRSSTGTACHARAQPGCTPEQGRAASGRRGGETATSRHRPGARSNGSQGSQPTAPRLQCSDRLGAAAADVAANLESGMWEEVARYQMARGTFMARNGGGSTNSGGGGGGGGAGTRSGEDLEVAEYALLRSLDGASSAPASGADKWPESPQGPQPDPAFLEWRKRLLSPLPCERAGRTYPRDPGSQRRIGTDDADGAKSGKGRRLGACEAEAQGELGTPEEVERLQRSLLMLLDEVEGRQQLRAHEELQRQRTDGAKLWKGRDSSRQGQRGSVEEDSRRLTEEFENWYCWNMVGAALVGVLR
ncbi:unnamed protein product, partial [Hapterophycus canaliculatus]